MKTPSKILTDAADLIERDGWCQGRSRNGKARCVSAALKARSDPSVGRLEAFMTLRSVINRHAIPLWNDEPGRTKEEVVSVLREAAKRAET